MKRARVWLRVSTDKQDEGNQLEACRRRIAYGDAGVPWAFDEGRDIYRAHDVSGDDLEAPERRLVLADARAGKFDVLVVWALDRWTRAGILTLLGDLEAFKKLGVRLVSVQEDWADNELMYAVSAWQARRELERIRRRTRAAIDERKRQLTDRGWFVNRRGEKVTALGRRRVLEGEALARACALRAGGASWGAVARALAAEGLGEFKRGTVQSAVVAATDAA